MKKIVRAVNEVFLRVIMIIVYLFGVSVAHLLFRVSIFLKGNSSRSGELVRSKLSTREIDWDSPY